MSLLQSVVNRARAVPGLAWQLSALPAQLLPRRDDPRGQLPFLAAVTGTAAFGVVDWPVALLIAGGYLLVRRPDLAHQPPEDVTEPAAGTSTTRVPPMPTAPIPMPATPVPPAPDRPASPRATEPPREPWPGYDGMRAPEVIGRLDDAGVDLAAVDRYEAAHRGRKTVRAAITARRSADT